METPDRAEAQAHYARQAHIASAAVSATRPLFKAKAPLHQIVERVSAYQFASATAAAATVARWSGAQQMTNAQSYAGVSSLGFPISEPIVATIDQRVPAPAETLPDPWWKDPVLFQHAVELLIASEVADAGRSAGQAEAAGHGWNGYVRVLTPPSCGRCTILAGRWYRWNAGFKRHPGCDCVGVPSNDDRASNPLLTDPREAFSTGGVRGVSKADTQAIADGADPAKVINATRGLGAPGVTAAGRTEVFGHTVKYTTEATTKRAAWRKANPTRLVRLRPETIYREAADQADAVRLLKLYGYF